MVKMDLYYNTYFNQIENEFIHDYYVTCYLTDRKQFVEFQDEPK